MIVFRFLAIALILSVLLPAIGAAQDAVKGERVWKKCRACHEVGPEAKNKVGPHLNGLLGRPAANVDDFKYSIAMTEAAAGGLVWEEDSLDLFLKRPKSFIKKTRMAFSGLKKEKDRANLIAFLKIRSSNDAGQSRNDPKVPADVLALAGDLEYGQYLSATCVACHQLNGEDRGIPSITGWPTEVFVTVMHSYRQKFRENPVMQQIAGSLNAEEIAALAAYFTNIKNDE